MMGTDPPTGRRLRVPTELRPRILRDGDDESLTIKRFPTPPPGPEVTIPARPMSKPEPKPRPKPTPRAKAKPKKKRESKPKSKPKRKVTPEGDPGKPQAKGPPREKSQPRAKAESTQPAPSDLAPGTPPAPPGPPGGRRSPTSSAPRMASPMPNPSPTPEPAQNPGFSHREADPSDRPWVPPPLIVARPKDSARPGIWSRIWEWLRTH